MTPVAAPVTESPAAEIVAEPLGMQPLTGDPRSQQMAAYLNDSAERGLFMGSVLVAHNGDLLLYEGYGQADVEASIPNTPQTQFRIGSLTKQFTAAAILKLQEQGLLNVQDPVYKYMPDYPRGDQITIHHLLTHTAGIPNYERRPDLPQVVQSFIPLDELIASFSSQPLQFSPGQQYEYSSSGYVVLTKIIEIVSGQSYADYLEAELLIPAGLTHSGYDYLAPDLPNAAVGYQLTPGGPQPAIRTDSSWPTGAGALYSTLEDLYRWDRLLYGDSILTAASREAMFAPWADTGQGAQYGYGWDIGNTAGRPSVVHGGGIFGFASYMARFPQDDALIIVLSNGIQMPPRLIAEDLAQMLFSGQ
jgi:CubicO group peptidase (beta-lactamase class C family)